MSKHKPKYGAYRPHPRVGLADFSHSRAKQSFRDECNINNIMKRYENTGLIDHVAKRPGAFLDLVNYPDYHEGLNAIRDAESAFMAMPSNLRKRFGNDPAQLMAFMSNPDNLNEAVQLGLVNPPPPPPRPPETPPEPRDSGGGGSGPA